MYDKQISILLIEDSAPDADMVREMLGDSIGSRFTLEQATRVSDGLERLAEGDFDVVLLDLSLPDSIGLDTFTEVHSKAPWIPIVVLSGSGNEVMAIQAVQEGAQDYLVKGEVDGGSLARSLRYAVERKQSAEALRRERDLVARLMDTSPVSITVVDRHGKIIFANARAEEVLGITLDEITQRVYNAPAWHITDFDGEPFPDEKLPFRKVMETKSPVYDVRHAIEWPDGRRRLLSINAAPILDEACADRQVEKVVFAIEDVTKQVEAERERIEQLKREIMAVEQINALPNTTISARAFGAAPLRESTPEVFAQLVDVYEKLLDTALERHAYKVESEGAEDVRDLAERFGSLRAGPRDVVDVHITALKNKTEQSNPQKGTAYAEEGRLIALELMGRLVSYYRDRCVSFRHFDVPHRS